MLGTSKRGNCDKLVIYPPLKKSVCFVDAIYLFEPALLGLIDFKVVIELAPEQAAQQEAQRDSHRSDANYLAYKRIVTNLYCETYLKRYRAEMDLVIEGGALRESLSRPFTTP